MNLLIDYLEEYGIVYAKASGRMTWDESIKLSEEMLAAGREHRVNRFFIDCQDVKVALSILEIDKLPTMFKNTGFCQGDKIAILCDPSSPDGSLLTFFQNVACLTLLQSRVFGDKDEAIDWLKSYY